MICSIVKAFEWNFHIRLFQTVYLFLAFYAFLQFSSYQKILDDYHDSNLLKDQSYAINFSLAFIAMIMLLYFPYLLKNLIKNNDVFDKTFLDLESVGGNSEKDT